MENREEQGLGLSPWGSATTSDEFWDRSLEDNPQFPISVALAEIVDGSRQVFTPSNRPSSVTGPNNSSGSQLRLTRPQAKTTHTFSRPIDTTIPSSSMALSGIRSNEFYRSRWSTNYLYPPNQTIPSFDPYSLPPFWHGHITGRYGQGTPLDSSISEDIKALTSSRLLPRPNTWNWVTVFLCSRRKTFPLLSMPKPVKVLIIWIPTGKTHFLSHLEVRRVIFYPTMKFALLFLAEGPNLHVL